MSARLSAFDAALSTPATRVARLAADETTVRRIADLLSETLNPAEIATAAFEHTEGSWLVEIYYHDAAIESAIRDAIKAAAGEAIAQALVIDTLAQTDWVAASLQGLTPVEAGRFVIHGGHDRGNTPINRLAIEVEAALAFGTGHHGTTRGCLLAFDRFIKARHPRRVLDIGTGTGVLAIAAAKALRRPILAGDIDAVAVNTARTNARINRVGPFIDVVKAAGVSARPIRGRGPFDLVFANILLGPLKRLAKPVRALLAPNARIILSGLLPGHTNSAMAAYRSHGLVLERRLDLDGWTTMVMARHGPARHPLRLSSPGSCYR